MSIRLTGLALLAAITCHNDIVYGAPADVISSMTDSGVAVTNGSAGCHPLTINNRYPLTNPENLPNNGSRYAIGIVADLDKESKDSNKAYTWHSYFKRGSLSYHPGTNPPVTVEWDTTPTNETQFTSHLSEDGRSMELSELITYDGNLITIDDKTGIIYKIKGDELQPWVILLSGDGQGVKEMKCEWATVKDSKLIVGSHGTERVKNGKTSYDNMWIKVIDKNGVVENESWVDNFHAVRREMKIGPSGYVTHEACMWSDHQKKWFLLPRKASNDTHNYKNDQTKGTNALVIASEDFKNIQVCALYCDSERVKVGGQTIAETVRSNVVHVGEVIPDRGFSSFKFVPNTADTMIAAIKTKEMDDTTATFITVFTVQGEIVYPETLVSDMKFEGLEFT